MVQGLNDRVRAAAAAPAGAAAALSSRLADAKQERLKETYKGCKERATLGDDAGKSHNPERVEAMVGPRGCNPFRVEA